MTAVLGSPAGIQWPQAAQRKVGRRRDGDRAVVVPSVPAEPRLRLTSRCRSLLLVAALLAVVGGGLVHASGQLGITGIQPQTAGVWALAPGLPLGTADSGPGGGVRADVGVRARSVQAAPTPGVVVVVVGDSLWGIATRCSGAGPAAAVSWIRAANGLHGSLLQPGQRLVIPAGMQCSST